MDGYRGIAILVVMLHHAALSQGYPGRLRVLVPFIHGGVTAFLVLSGFLITVSLLRDEARAGQISLRDFYERQAVRFGVPVLAYLAVISILFGLLASAVPWAGLGHVLTLHPATASTDLRTAHLYSMVLQVQFCLLWPLVLRSVSRPVRLPLTIALASGAALWGVVGPFWDTQSQGGRERTDFLFGPLLVGAAFALLSSGRAPEKTCERSLLPQFLGALGALGAVIVTRSPSRTLAWVSPSLVGSLAAWHDHPLRVVAVRWVAEMAALAALGYLVHQVVRNRAAFSARFLRLPPLVWLGRISFSVYLWQNLFFFCVRDTRAGRFPWNLASAIACGLIAYFVVELPSLRWRSRLVLGQRAKPGESRSADVVQSAVTPAK